MVDQLNMMMHRDGQEAAVAYAKQTLAIYRECAKRKPNKPVHFAHILPFRPHFVRAIMFLRSYLRNGA